MTFPSGLLASKTCRATLLLFSLAILLGASALFLTAARPSRHVNGAPKLATQQVSQNNLQAQVRKNLRQLPLSFEKNEGQTDPRVQFLARTSNYTVFLTRDEAVFSLKNAPADSRTLHTAETVTAVHMNLLGANPTSAADGLETLPGQTNYIRGNDPAQWHTNVPNYSRIRYQNAYPGIDLVYYGNQGQLECDFVLAPHADPQAVALNFTGADNITVDPSSGALLVGVGMQQLRLHAPIAYLQDASDRANSQPVDVHYVIDSHRNVRLKVAPYDRSRTLVIDPAISYSTYLGGSANDFGTALTVDVNGNVYLSGYTASSTFPVTSGVFQPTCTLGCGSQVDAFVSKIDPTGTTLLYSTFLGGNANDYGNGIAIDPAGDAYIVGQTFSSNFPVTSGAFQTHCGGNNCTGGQAFITELNPAGSALVYSTYLGGSHVNQGNAIVLDSLNNAYITGFTQSLDFPVTSGAFQKQCSCSSIPDVFVTKLSSTGKSLLYSSYLGGNGPDIGYSIALDSANNAYVAGYSGSSNFPVSSGAFQTTLKAETAAFVSEVNPTGSALVYSTYVGGSNTATTPCEACATAIAVDGFGQATIVGLTAEANFPTTPGAYQTTFRSSSNGHDAFVTQLNSTGTALVFSTFLGGTSDDGAVSVAIEPSGNVWVRGNTKSTDFPVTGGAPQPVLAGNYDFFLAELNPGGSSLLFSTFLGGTGVEYGGATKLLALDGQTPPNVYVSGYTASTNFPTTTGVVQARLAGGNDATLTRFVPSPNVGLSASSLAFGSIVVGRTSTAQSVTITNNGNLNLNAPTISVTGANKSDFTQTNTCVANLAPQGTCTITVTFSPSVFTAEAASITITDNAPNSPQSIALSGTGIDNGPAVTLSPTSLVFPTVLLNTKSRAQTVTLSNPGTATLSISSLTVSNNFSQTNTCGSSVLAGASCTITVTFGPLQINTITGSLTITDNASTSPQSASLSGVGTAVKISAPSINFGTVNVGTTTSAQKITVTNVGSTPLTISPTTLTGPNPTEFAQTNTCGTSLNAGANCTYSITFTPAAKGLQNAFLNINDNGGASPQLITLVGKGQ